MSLPRPWVLRCEFPGGSLELVVWRRSEIHQRSERAEIVGVPVQSNDLVDSDFRYVAGETPARIDFAVQHGFLGGRRHYSSEQFI